MHAEGSDDKGSDGVLIDAAAGGSVVAIILILVGILVIVARWLCKKHHSDKNSNSSAFDPDTTASVEMDKNPSYEIINEDSNPIKINSDPLYHLPTDSSDWMKITVEAHKKTIVQMETDPIYQSTIRDGKMYGITDYRS